MKRFSSGKGQDGGHGRLYRNLRKGSNPFQGVLEAGGTGMGIAGIDGCSSAAIFVIMNRANSPEIRSEPFKRTEGGPS
jgi:hypothetical protein